MVNYEILKIKNSWQIRADFNDTFLTFRFDKHRAIIDYLLVNNKIRNQGIGRELIHRFENFIKANGITVIWLRACQWDNTSQANILKFYEKNNYITVDNDYKGIGIIMKKRLN
jgi:GNAT superfamily N-acetyltransferase